MTKKIDIDTVLENVKRVRASLAVMNNSIDAFFGAAWECLELEALVLHTEQVIAMNIDNLDRLIGELREQGAKDWPPLCEHSSDCPEKLDS